MKRNKILALIGAGVLTMGVAGVALAEDLNSGQVGKALSTFTQDCTGFPLEVGEGQIGVHFVLTTPDGGATSALLDATFSTDTVTDVPNTPKPSTTLHFYVVITGDGDTTIDSASTDVNGGKLNVSHVCGEGSTTTTTSFESSEESTTDSQSSSSEESSTTSFSDSVSDSTTQPPTDTIGQTGSGQQSSGLWMLLAVLGVLAGSVIVLAPSKANKE